MISNINVLSISSKLVTKWVVFRAHKATRAVVGEGWTSTFLWNHWLEDKVLFYVIVSWTNDQELTEFLQECGVTDLINIKFFENRTNGQSKGWVGSTSRWLYFNLYELSWNRVLAEFSGTQCNAFLCFYEIFAYQ